MHDHISIVNHCREYHNLELINGHRRSLIHLSQCSTLVLIQSAGRVHPANNRWTHGLTNENRMLEINAPPVLEVLRVVLPVLAGSYYLVSDASQFQRVMRVWAVQLYTESPIVWVIYDRSRDSSWRVTYPHCLTACSHGPPAPAVQRIQTNNERDLSRKLGFRPSVCLWDEQYKGERQIMSEAYNGS